MKNNEINIRIEDLHHINRELSHWNLFMRYWEWQDYVIVSSILIISLILIAYGVSPDGKLCVALLGAGLIIGAFFYANEKDNKIISKQYSYVSAKKSKPQKIQEIYIKIFKEHINNPHFLKPKNIEFVINAIQREQEMQSYQSFGLFQTFLVSSITVLATLFFTGSMEYALSGFDDFLKLFKMMGGIFILALGQFYFIEFVIFREFILWRRQKKLRLIKVLENIYLEQVMISKR
ncbi:hypothetical protein [Phocoenobacter skyensis]|uniref:Uncharacterized protein n=1 Tax=Phocoenobacter skyensis TaxID=97481 RepID=A0A1H7UE17_9PAST|nr:hypothetical protein [Pasteurella skyensis]MDP8080056.1 hypothetical protein [Pasteurella skyensis]MDP8086046.1 hypothetical protein [Pasteurella skyensis]MDP8184594.1 hypothetical protein [Pasteurella skyensis]SEL95211.1 hypothetical protein SAMN05444853_10231 [Pasteurella skyensis]